MIHHRRSIGFKALFAKLPPDIQAEAKSRFKLLQENPAHPQLHFKEFRDTGGGIHKPGTFSVRVTSNYRVLGTEVASKPQVIVWWFIGTHTDYMKLASSVKAYSPKRLKEEELFEAPQELNATEFNLDDPKVNRRLAHDFTHNGEKLEDVTERLSLWQRGRRIALVLEDPGKPRSLIYYVQWKERFHKLIGHKAISQVAVWRDALDPRSKGIAAKIFWEHLLPIHEVMMTDTMQTPDGKRFWTNRVAEAFEHRLRVYYLNLLPAPATGERELIEIHDLQHFADLAREKDFWGREDLHQARKIIISDKELTPPGAE